MIERTMGKLNYMNFEVKLYVGAASVRIAERSD